MKKIICLFAITFWTVQSLFSQLTNKNEYIKITDELFSQYSPKEKGWVIFKYDTREKKYIKQEYTVSASNTKQSLFKNIYVGAKYAIFTNDGAQFKFLDTYSNTISSVYKEILIYNFPKINGNFPHIIGKEIDNKYISLNDNPMSCDTFALQNGTFIPIFNKDNPKINDNVFTQNGFVVPQLYGVIGYNYSIRKTQQGFILSDGRIMFNQMGYLIHSYPEMGAGHMNPLLNKQFPLGVNLSYYDGNNFLISEKNSWYVCKVSENEQNFSAYLTDVKSILPKDETLYSYFGELEANSIRVLTWESGNPAYFIANIKGVDYLYDYRKADTKIRGSNRIITFPQRLEISGESVKPFYSESGKAWNYNGMDEKPRYLEVKQGNLMVFYKYQDGEFNKIAENPFKGNYKAVFTGSTYREYDNEHFGQILSEKVFPPEMSIADVAKEEELLHKGEQLQSIEKNRVKTDVLKTAIMNSQISYFSYNTFYYGKDNYYCNFPFKYYDGNQLFYNCIDRDDLSPYLVNDNNEIVKLNECNEYGQDDAKGYESGTDVLSIGSSTKTERFTFTSPHTLPNINSSFFQQIGEGISSYDRKSYLITKTFSVTINKTQGSCDFVGAKLLSYKDIFVESPDVNDVQIIYSSRLSNNDILVILKAKIEFLSGQLNRMFGINGAGNVSRTFNTESYFKFIVISEDGSILKSNKNYLIQGNLIRPIENGFIILSDNLGDVISLDNKDFGRKSFVYSQDAGKNILVTEGISFSNKVSYEKGIKLFKFNNSADLVKVIVVDNPTDANIGKPIPMYLQHSENFLCLYYVSFDQAVVNEAVYVSKLFDFDLNLKSTVVGKKYEVIDDVDLITAKDDIFYINYDKGRGEREIIPFK